MSGRDGTGPLGMGSMTGRGLGNCISYGLPLLAGAVAGFCFRRKGRGFAAGMNNWQRGLSQDAELNTLKNQAITLEANLDNIKKRIQELEQK